MAWFVNKPADPSNVSEFLSSGRWHSPTPKAHAATLHQMRPGDRIACKSVGNRRTGLPFFNADRPASVMTIHATGVVTDVDAEAGVVEVSWEPAEPREWYFWTALRSLWRVTSARPEGQDLLRFTFTGEPQDLHSYLNREFWSDRYVPQPTFSWTDFYTQFASRLAEHSDNRAELLSKVLTAADSEPMLTYLVHDRFHDGTAGPITDLDPFTVMAAFNRNVRTENRLRVAAALGDILGVEAEPPQDFDGVPLVNNQNSWFVRFSADRRPEDIDLLWDIFTAALRLAETDNEAHREAFATAYDAAQQVSGVRWNLSQGLFWARPTTFMTLEGQSRPFLRSHFALTEPADGRAYLRLLDELTARFRSGTTSITSFPELSYAAWLAGRHQQTPATVAGFAHWAVRMAEAIDLETQEHTYKRQAASVLAHARAQAQAGDPEWPSTLKDGLAEAGNLLHYMFKDDVAKAVRADAGAWREAFTALWDDPTPASLDDLQKALRERLPKAPPGNCTGLGALLLMGVDAEDNAPYLTTRTDTWYRLAGFPGPASRDSAADRYGTLLRFLDQVREEIEALTGMPVSRLEAQGMAWGVTEYPVPEDWDEASKQALQAFRGAEQKAPVRAWLVRSAQVDPADWLGNDYVSLPATFLGTVEPGADQKVVRSAVEAGYPQLDSADREAMVTATHAFLSRIRAEDYVVATGNGELHVGQIAGGPTYVEEHAGDRLRRDVEWLVSIDAEQALPDRLDGLLNRQGAVVDLSDAVSEIESLLHSPEGVRPSGPPPMPPTAAEQLMLPRVSEALAETLHMEPAHLQEIADLLAARRQIVLYGPPGTGKTYLALELARHLTGPAKRSNVQLVQFHPSYAYEDFVEGFRPVETASGQPGFEVRHGPLRRIVTEAKARPTEPFILIIDEMNRANLAKVFGELYFLLEYRKQSVNLQYSPETPFDLPTNLFFIGTMNTADRSVALLDAAMRRRFAFVELHPDEAPVRDVLSTYLRANNASQERAHLLDALNAAIEDNDRDFKIGPSYLMRDGAETAEGLDRVWRYDVLPLLEEHYYGRLNRTEVHDRFGLAALRATLRRAVGGPADHALDPPGEA